MRGKAARRALVVIVISCENNDPAPLPARIPSRRRHWRHRLICDGVQVMKMVTLCCGSQSACGGLKKPRADGIAYPSSRPRCSRCRGRLRREIKLAPPPTATIRAYMPLWLSDRITYRGKGFDTKAVRKIIRLRKQDQAERQEEEAILDLYKAALGMT